MSPKDAKRATPPPPIASVPSPSTSNRSRRSRYQFSLRWLLIVVTLAAIALGILSVIDSGVRIIAYSVVYVVLPTPLLIAAIYDRDDYRAFAIGAILPWATLWLNGPQRGGLVGDTIWLITTGTVCGVIAVVARRWIERRDGRGGK
jgi:hypothetical protein